MSLRASGPSGSTTTWPAKPTGVARVSPSKAQTGPLRDSNVCFVVEFLPTCSLAACVSAAELARIPSAETRFATRRPTALTEDLRAPAPDSLPKRRQEQPERRSNDEQHEQRHRAHEDSLTDTGVAPHGCPGSGLPGFGGGSLGPLELHDLRAYLTLPLLERVERLVVAVGDAVRRRATGSDATASEPHHDRTGQCGDEHRSDEDRFRHATYYSIVGDLARRLAISMLVLLVATLALPSTSLAHSYLVRSEPEAGERLRAAPRELKLFFSEPFAARSERVTVRFSSGEKPNLPAPARRDTVVSQALPRVEDEVMIVNWRVVAVDGHISTGEFAFAVGTTARLPEVASSSETSTDGIDVILSWSFFAGLALALGGLVSERFVWQRERLDPTIARAPVLAGLALAAVATVLQLLTLEADLASRPAKLLGAQSLLLVGALALLREARSLAILPLLAAAAVTAARGHSGTSGEWWAVPVDALHLAAAAIWAGALVHLVLLARRLGLDGFKPFLATGAGRYARLALATVGMSIVGGVGTALAQFGSLGELVDTSYGQALIVKSALIGVALAIAGAARTFALPGGGLVERVRSRELAAVAIALLVFALLFGPQPGHLAAATLFTGSLLYVALLVLRRGTWSGIRYLGVAGTSLLALFGAGAMAAAADADVQEPTDWGTWVAVVQIGLAAAGIGLLLVLGLRTVRPSPDGSVPLLRRLTGAETLVLAAALGAAALLVNVAPPRGQAAAFETLGPPPLRGPTIRMGRFVGQLAVGIAATERELRFEIISPGSLAARGSEIAVEARQPGKLSADLYPRPCGDGCFTIRFRLPRGTTTIEARVAAPGRTGGTARFDIPWPPQREQSQLLARVARTMAAQPKLRVTELVTSGPGTNTKPLGAVLSGRRLLESEAYGRGGVDVRVVGRTADLTELVFALPPSKLWYRMWIDNRFRVRRQVLVNRGHRITRTFEYDVP